MIELSVNNLVKYLDADKIFDGISFNVYDSEKVGIVGINGSGKSTILKVIAGIYEIGSADKGNVFLPKGIEIGYLAQVMPEKESKKVIDVLYEAFGEIASLEEEIKKVENKLRTEQGEELEKIMKRYSILQEEYLAKGGYEKEERLSRVCTGLNMDENFLKKDFDLLSGGEKTRVMLGKILLKQPEMLLLDEPTNHLDMKAVEWLESYLKSYKGMALIVSHDRYFLDNVVDKIIEIEDMNCTTYKGNYSSYVKQKEENIMLQFAAYKEQQKKIKAMEKAIKDLRDWAARADNSKFYKRAASMQKALERMNKINKPKMENDKMKLILNEGQRSGNDVITIRDLNKSFIDNELFKAANLNIYYQDRVALIGENGCGKTTLLKMILHEESEFAGMIKLGANINLAYLPQNIIFEDEEATVLEDFRRDLEILEGKAREYLAKFMFYGATVFRKIKHLSGGERIRLKLSKLLYNDINLLILDEPTNHLDIESIENLEDALRNFRGTILFISHDRYFINSMSNKIIEIENKKLHSFAGNYEYYKNEKEKLLKAQNESITKVKKKKEKISKPVDEGKKLRKIIEDCQQKISLTEEKIKEIEEEMELFSSQYNKLSELTERKNSYERILEETFALWEEKAEELEKIL